MPVPYAKIRKILDKSTVSVPSVDKGSYKVNDSASFKGLPLSEIEEITELIDTNSKKDAEKKYDRTFDSVSDVRAKSMESARQASIAVMNKSSMDSIHREIYKGANIKDIVGGKVSAHDYTRTMDSVYNNALNINNSYDKTNDISIEPNIWISPWEASNIYSQKGLIETVLNKKAKSVQLNGVKIQNPRLSARQIDLVSENLFMKNTANLISDTLLTSLIYGGSLVFPLFKKDTPLTTNLSISSLIKLGIIEKGCIDRFIELDRWNTMILPATSPTQKDFVKPDKFFIPYLGSWVSGQRCARVVPNKQAGWFGYMFNQGWGLSDIVGYYKEFCDYTISMRQIPLMLNQMSILVRTLNPDGILATEGANALREMLDSETVNMREVSVNNPITMDVFGELTSVNRDFAEVVNLMRLLQQDFGAKANIPAPLIWSYEKGAFSSGDDTEGQLSKQWESTKYLHKDTEVQCKEFAMLLVLDTLGVSKEIMEALPYTNIKFDTPIIANANERAKVGNLLSDAYFNFVSGQMPMDKALELVSNFASDDMSISSEIIEGLKNRQTEFDELANRKQELEMEQMQKNLDTVEEKEPKVQKFHKTKEEKKKEEKEEGYSRLEQKQHEKVRTDSSKRKEALVKQQNKIERE